MFTLFMSPAQATVSQPVSVFMLFVSALKSVVWKRRTAPPPSISMSKHCLSINWTFLNPETAG